MYVCVFVNHRRTNTSNNSEIIQKQLYIPTVKYKLIARYKSSQQHTKIYLPNYIQIGTMHIHF